MAKKHPTIDEVEDEIDDIDEDGDEVDPKELDDDVENEDEDTEEEDGEDESDTEESDERFDEDEEDGKEKPSKDTKDAEKKSPEEKESKDDKSDKQGRDKQKDAEYAARRRAWEDKVKQEKAQQEMVHKAELQGVAKALGYVNPITNDKMETVEDIEYYLTQREMEKQSLDPKDSNAYRKFMQTQAKNKPVGKIDANHDINEFIAQHPDVDLKELTESDDFNLFAEGKWGIVPLTKIYTDYVKLTTKTRNEATKKVEKNLAKSKASAGTLHGKSANVESQYFTLAQINRMETSEILAHYEKVEASMEYWKTHKSPK